MKKLLYAVLICIFLAACESNTSIVNNVGEREANEIVVFLASKGIAAQKIQAASTETAGAIAAITWDIHVDKSKQVEAMAVLNQVGLPRLKGTNLLTLFAKTGLMTSDKEETIRYQAGVEEELKNTIRKIDGVIDADIKITFPSETAGGLGAEQTASPKIKAAVYVKHQGILDDPNQHLDSKIKRLIAGSIENLSYDDVTIISDKSRFTDIKFPSDTQLIGSRELEKEYVKIWSIIMTKSSAKKFRFIFFSLIIVIFAFAAAAGWLIYKFYPIYKSSKKQDK